MLKVAYLIIALCLIIWAVGFFVYGVGLIIHSLLVIAVVVASIKVLKK